jgi:hypothetical protein
VPKLIKEPKSSGCFNCRGPVGEAQVISEKNLKPYGYEVKYWCDGCNRFMGSDFTLERST